MKGYVYKITSPTGKVYIGKTTDVKKRKMYYAYGHCKPQKILYSSIKKYGWDSHKFEIIKEVDDISSLNRAERELILEHKTNLLKYPEDGGMNLADGGEGNSGPKSIDWKNKMKERWDSIEYREKMKKIHKSKEWIEKCRNRQLGKKFSEETKQKMREPMTEEHKEKLRKPKSKRTKEHCLNLSVANKGRKLSEGHKKMIKERQSKPIVQTTLTGEFVKEWESIKQAENTLNLFNIGRVCNEKQNSSGGFKWKFKK
jgi:group I intron endonuclease